MPSARLVVASGAAMRALGRRLAGLLEPGDLVVLTGELGAGKTTLAQGVGAGLGVRGPVTSPTFVIARVHPSEVGGPALVHVDAYRLGGIAEVDDLDLDASLEDSVTLVEWGEGLVEDLAPDRLEVRIERPHGAAGVGPDGGPATGRGPADGPDTGPDDEPDDEPRTVTLTGVGARWATARLDGGSGAAGPVA